MLSIKSQKIAEYFVRFGSIEAFSKGLNILLIICLASLMPIDNYGVVATLMVLELVLIELFLFGQNTLIFRKYLITAPKRFMEYIGGILIVIFSILLFLMTGLLVFHDQLPLTILPFITANHLIILMLAVFAQTFNTIYQSYLRIREDISNYGKLRIFSQFSRFVVTLAFVFATPTVEAFLLGLLVANWLSLTFCIILNKLSDARLYFVKSAINTAKLTENLKFGTPLVTHSLVGALYSGIDRLLLGNLLQNEDVAIYHFAATLGAMPFFIIYVFAMVFMPKFYADQEYSARSRESLNLFLICSLAGCLVSAIIIYNIIFPLSMMFVESRFSDGHEVVLILSIVVMLQCFSNRGVYLLTILSKVSVIPLSTVSSLLLNFTLALYFIPLHGLKGAAYAVLIAEIMNAIILNAACAYLIYIQKSRSEK